MPVTDAELSRRLGGAQVARRPWPYSSSHAIEELRVGPNGSRLLLKHLSAASRSRPSFTANPLAEITAYRDVLAPNGIDAPRYVASVMHRDRGWLVVELVNGRPLWQLGEPAAWEQAARSLARLHALSVPASGGLLRYDAAHLRRRLELATWLPGVKRIAAAAAARLADLPVSFIHGEFTPSNVMVSRRGGVFRIRPVDWETAGLGPGVLDLAALTAGWEDEQRSRIVAAYQQEQGVGPATEEQLDLARLVLAAQWSGWTKRWVPPSEHSHDWRHEVCVLVERLRL
jgi:aminoglycoside phosphotransferase (APT) family kinase protein